MQRLRWSFALVAALLAVAAVPAAAVADDEPPVITSASVTPTSLPLTGGTATIKADVTDDVGLDRVYAEINGNDSSYQTVELAKQSGTLWSATITLPPNNTTEQISYGITVWAVDTSGFTIDHTAGEVSVNATPDLDEPPIVGELSLTPTSLPFGGGAVTIKANAEDHRSVSEVYARVTLPDGSIAPDVPMENLGGNSYQGTFSVPANTRTTSVQYTFAVTAIDDIGQPTTEDAGKVTVAGRPAPSTGKLKLAPGKLSLGDVRLGAFKQHRIEIRHEGKKTAAPITFAVRTSGAPFSIVGPSQFTLKPGEKAVVLVAFAPVTIGDAKGSLILERADGGQPGLAAALKGKGKRK